MSEILEDAVNEILESAEVNLTRREKRVLESILRLKLRVRFTKAANSATPSSTLTAQLKVYVIPTKEELLIARDAVRLINEDSSHQ